MHFRLDSPELKQQLDENFLENPEEYLDVALIGHEPRRKVWIFLVGAGAGLLVSFGFRAVGFVQQW
jgi:hypothetical protein